MPEREAALSIKMDSLERIFWTMSTRTALRNGMIALTVFALPLGTAGAALASPSVQGTMERALGDQGLQLVKGDKGGYHGKKGGPLGELTWMEAGNLAADVIASLSGKPVGEVRQAIQAEGMGKTLRAYDISKEDFAQAMQPKVLAMVEDAQKDGRITGEQAAQLKERIEQGPKQASKHEGRHTRGGAMGGLARMVGQNMFVDTVAQLSGKPATEVRQALEDEGPRDTLEAYGIDHQAFRDAMQVRARTLIEDVQKDGLITPEQADELIERMNREPHQHRG